MKSEVFKPDDIFNLRDRQKAQSQLETLGNFWIGRDVALEKEVIISPLSLVRNLNLTVNKTDFPVIDLNRGALGALNWSVRSCLAQTGTEIRFHRSDLSDEMLEDIKKGKNVAIPISIQNHINRPVKLEGKVMRFFWIDDRKRLRHEELRQALLSELIIEGEEGKDWSFGDVELEDDAIKMVAGADPEKLKDVCIILPLKERFYIPESTKPLVVKSKADLPAVLQEIPAGLKTDFKIGETAEVKLGENIIAVINTGVYDSSKRHIHSPLIDGGFEGKIRTETIRGLDHIELFLYRK